MMNKKLIVMCAIPGSGKSTWVKNHLHTFDGRTVVVSRDEVRFSLVKEDEEYFSRENEVFAKYIKDIKDGLNHADTVIADATHINKGSRCKLLRAIGKELKGVSVEAMCIRLPLEMALSQNENRKGTRSYVPENVIQRMSTQFTMPSFEEGFDKIYIYMPHKVGTKYSVFEKEN